MSVIRVIYRDSSQNDFLFREELERDMFENYSVPNRYNEEIKPLKIDPFDD